MKKAVQLATGAFALALACGLAAVADEQPAKVAGKWEISYQGPQGQITGTLTIEQNGEKIKGTIQGPRGQVGFEGTVKGNKIEFTVKSQTPRGEVVVEYTGKVESDTMKGTRQGPRGSTDWTAKRTK